MLGVSLVILDFSLGGLGLRVLLLQQWNALLLQVVEEVLLHVVLVPLRDERVSVNGDFKIGLDGFSSLPAQSVQDDFPVVLQVVGGDHDSLQKIFLSLHAHLYHLAHVLKHVLELLD